ncbi:MAG TPA: CorA family divalent cation transporter [Bacillota bacterium]|nr:CorA family divalent cation transporter [Bacillota bacterium]
MLITREARPADQVWWDCRGQATRQELGKVLGEAPPAADGRRPRLGVYSGSVRLLLDVTAAPEAPPRPLSLYLGRDAMATVHPGPAPEVEAIIADYQAGELDEEPVHMAAYRVLAKVVQGYTEAVDSVIDAAEAIDERLLDHRRRRVLDRVVAVRRDALRMRRILAPAVDLFGLLDGEDFPFIPKEHRAYFEDLHEQVRSLLDDVEGVRADMAEAVEAFTSVQSIEMNRVMKLLTFVSVIFLPGTLIASIYGMNFHIPEYNWPWGYAWALGLTALLTVVLVSYIRSHNWMD